MFNLINIIVSFSLLVIGFIDSGIIFPWLVSNNIFPIGVNIALIGVFFIANIFIFFVSHKWIKRR